MPGDQEVEAATAAYIKMANTSTLDFGLPCMLRLMLPRRFAMQWHFTVQAWVGTQGGADALIKTIEVIKPLLAENAPAVPVNE